MRTDFRLRHGRAYLVALISISIWAMLAESATAAEIPAYAISVTDVQAIRAMPAAIELGRFSSDPIDVSCRLSSIAPQNDQSYVAYIREAFNSELVVTGPNPSGKKVVLSGALKSVDLDCGMGDGSWTIAMTLSVDNGPPFTIQTFASSRALFLARPWSSTPLRHSSLRCRIS